MNSIQKLTELFADFPGIGPRQARRFVYFLLTRHERYLEDLTSLIKELKKDIRVCDSCYRFFQEKNSQHLSTLCDICRNPNRDTSVLVIVSRDVDLENIEKTHAHHGLYFVLGGSVPILEKNPETRIRSKELLKIVKERINNSSDKKPENKEKLKEIILAMNATPEGENTGEYIENYLRPIIAEHNIKISHLGKGISTGTELEYSDTDTIRNALKNRQ
jgi:recombination protein RecR